MATLLLVDDHTVFSQALKKALEQIFPDFHICDADNGAEAVDIANNRLPDIVVLDLQIPKMNGIEVVKEFNRLKLTTKVIVLTMLDEPALIIHMLQLGVSCYLLKNCEIDELELAIRKTIAGEEYSSDLVSRVMKEYLSFPNSFANLNLSPREFQVLAMIKDGKTNKEIAESLNLKLDTIGSYRKTLMAKTRCKNSAELVSFAYNIGVNQPQRLRAKRRK